MAVNDFAFKCPVLNPGVLRAVPPFNLPREAAKREGWIGGKGGVSD
jgi:hypothetical protein